MKEKIKKIGIGIGIFVIIVITFSFWLFKQGEINYCKDKCVYRSPRESTRGLSDKGDYWVYIAMRFETQDQCIDYCLRNK